jgi:hypothetical protein
MCTHYYAITICTQILQGWGKGQHGLKREVDDVSNDVAGGDAPNDASTGSSMQHSAGAAGAGAAGDSAAAQIQSMKRRRSNSLGMHTSEVRTAVADTTAYLLLC